MLSHTPQQGVADVLNIRDARFSKIRSIYSVRL